MSDGYSDIGNDGSNTNRRTVLKGITGASSGVILGSVLSTPVKASSSCSLPDPNNTWEVSDEKENAKGKNEGIYLATSVGCIGAEFDSDYNVWRYKFKQNTVARSEKYPSGDSLNALSTQRSSVNQGTCDNLAEYTDNCYMGARPRQPDDGDPSFDYSDVAYEVANAAISEISTKVGYAITATELVASYMEATSGTDKPDYEIDREWTYGTSVFEEFSNYYFFEAWSSDGERNYFDVVTRVNSYYNNTPEAILSLELYNGYSPKIPSRDSTTSSGSYSTTKKSFSSEDESGHDWEIEKIPPEKSSVNKRKVIL
ncbi:hypothetical protein SY89_01247 [Halolamina pelagica]|uniref:Uncharacterized protein n=1 Tax=Halolamina pelagica TaxID=699431 RepID=A0A0P7GPH5_9EURY|nr:hypothetical protein [Halolamina pelagica]KPN30512.1 hypothetical protein SY89_01247 [Halolamina pelagica]